MFLLRDHNKLIRKANWIELVTVIQMNKWYLVYKE